MGSPSHLSESEGFMTVEKLWSPSPDALTSTRMGEFMSWLGDQGRGNFTDYAGLWQWSVDEPGRFWADIWQFFDVGEVAEPHEALADAAMPGASWFPDRTLNYARQVLRAPGRADDDVIVIGRSDSRDELTLTVARLRERVAAAATGLDRLGIGRGDRVAAYLPNIPEAVILLLACASRGAVFSSCAPEFGVRSVADRWKQIAPKLLVAVDGYQYGNKHIDRRDEVAALRTELDSLDNVVSLSYTGNDIPDALSWSELLSQPGELTFTDVPFDHPLYILYSSGTTGLPKPIVHGHGGITLEHLKMLALHHDLGPGDRFYWFCTTGWMMWNYLVSAPAVGAAMVLYDGNPTHPDFSAQWKLAAETGITNFGTSAPFLLACRKNGIVPREVADLSRLRGVGSTGSPLPPEGFAYVYEAIAPDAMLTSLSGGTDVCTGFVGGAPLVPVYKGEIACRCLGSRVEAFGPDGKPVLGETGELVITAPMPSMPVGFWGDEDGSRYREAYFDTYPGVWRHGDWITITDRGTCVITGRSDATLKRGGVRLGTSEFYSVVEALDEVNDSLVVHLEDDEGGPGRLLLFVVTAGGREVDDELRRTIARELRGSLSPRHVPDELYAVPAVPRTLSGKKLEIPVKRILTGTPIAEAAATGALANPESLEAFLAYSCQVENHD
ncbi:acetoacetate--CoA ligase [Stackebrandtia nassauensis]|uniref:Acetoacetyl-CoA synthase n=1 Tax=Stackebrandtia nassauensis (strain DSM 44728 / CIP 108903 / NRRL B-16338 / NBRC 102104 / LLR-40K-21) TaxID=446470 RepID=D3Q163_STANL|nr:acetoacetyl-CoA synthase [Stackebrandtia nassauensis DSM 44728]